MLEPRWRKVLRDAWLHKARTLLVVLAIAVGLASAGALLDAWALVRRATRELYLASEPAAATIRIDSLDDDLLAVVSSVPGIRAARGRREALVALRVDGSWQNALLFAFSDYDARRIGRLVPQSGDWPPRDGSLVVEQSSVAFSGAAVGERVGLTVGKSDPVSIPVTGIVRDVSLAPGWMEHVVYAYATPATFASLGLARSLNEIQILVDRSAATQDDVRVIAYAVKAAVERAGHRVTDVDVPVPGEHIHAAQMNSLLYTQGAFGVLALVVCGFLVVNLVAAMLAGQVREIGVMKTLGARPMQIAVMYLAYAAALGAIASLIALPVALRVGRSYATLKAELLNFDVAGMAVPWWAVGLQILVGILVPVAAAAFPVVNGCRRPVADALRDFGLDHDGVAAARSGEPFASRIGWPSRPARLSIRNAFRKRGRMTLTLLALASGGAVFLAAANLRRSVQRAVDDLFAPQRYAFSVRLSDAHRPDSIEAIVLRVGGVSSAEAWTGARAAVVHVGPSGATMSGNAFPITAPPVDTRLLVPRIESGRWVRAIDGAAVVVSRSLVQREPTLLPGRRVTLDVGGRRGEWTIVGIADAGPLPSAFASRAAIVANSGEPGVSTVMVGSVMPGIGAQVDLIQRVRAGLATAGFAVSGSQLVEENRRVMQDHLLMVVQFLAVMGWVMVAVGGMGLASTMSLAVLERTREIGVLRSIGARHGAIMALIQTEGLVITLASWLCAIPLSMPMSVALANAFSRVMLEVRGTVLPTGAAVVEWLAVLVTICVVACAWPAVRATRVPIARALAYE